MIQHGLGNLFSLLKQMELELLEIEKRIANGVLSNSTDKDWYKKLVEDYRQKRAEFDNWLTKKVYEKEE
ncbi:hypothetical protein NV379_02160 [Paenibacillus sp. N1-5-1-14]|nr:hypothetical protein [Paenibacillus radicibacter]